MKQFAEQKFNIPALKGISAKNIEEHLKLYAGYVKNANAVLEKIEEYRKDSERNTLALAELQRRFAFEFDGMRNHEYYFRSLEGGSTPLATGGVLQKVIEEEWGSFDKWLAIFKSIALTRGIGWAVLYWDPQTKQLLRQWIDEQHLGHLNGLPWILGIDMWEHAFVYDYQPSGKKNYIEDFFQNLNWGVIERNFTEATK
ncbi:superoxide dismutase [Patescibacteria group bacterium]|nr:MAG: superoxide dismutase [Patescibacteria group bacterium]